VIGVAPPRDRIQVTLRYNLPDPPEADLVAEIAARAVGALRSQRLTAAVAVGYGPETLVTSAADEYPRSNGPAAHWHSSDQGRLRPGQCRLAPQGPRCRTRVKGWLGGLAVR
jgi:hypothetical protein